MSYFAKYPEARRAYRARWAAAWRRLLETGAAAPEEEEATRREILRESGGAASSNDLDGKGYQAVMLHLGMILGERESAMRAPWRARRIAKIEAIARELRSDDPESYVVGVLDGMNAVRDPAKWRTALIDDDLHRLMLTMVSQQRRGKVGRNDQGRATQGAKEDA